MTLAVCVIDTRPDLSPAVKAVQHTIKVLNECHPTECVYWISHEPEAPVRFGVRTHAIQISPIEQFPLDYNRVCLHLLPELIPEDHVLIIQADGHAVNASAWSPEFLKYDYVGACWPDHWNLSHQVGNGGFSLRSRKLLQSIKKLNVTVSDRHEDYQICLDMRAELEALGCVWAPPNLADQFSTENNIHSVWQGTSFGFHGDYWKHLMLMETPCPR